MSCAQKCWRRLSALEQRRPRFWGRYVRRPPQIELRRRRNDHRASRNLERARDVATPVVSSAKKMSPGPNARVEPSPHSSSARPLTVITNWRRSACAPRRVLRGTRRLPVAGQQRADQPVAHPAPIRQLGGKRPRRHPFVVRVGILEVIAKAPRPPHHPREHRGERRDHPAVPARAGVLTAVVERIGVLGHVGPVHDLRVAHRVATPQRLGLLPDPRLREVRQLRVDLHDRLREPLAHPHRAALPRGQRELRPRPRDMRALRLRGDLDLDALLTLRREAAPELALGHALPPLRLRHRGHRRTHPALTPHLPRRR